MTTLYIVTRLDMEENEFETFRVAHKSYYDAVTAVIEDMNSLVDDDHPAASRHDDNPEKVDRASLEIHKIAPDEWATSDLAGFGWTVTEVTVEE